MYISRFQKFLKDGQYSLKLDDKSDFRNDDFSHNLLLYSKKYITSFIHMHSRRYSLAERVNCDA